MVDASEDSPVVDEFGCLELIRSKKCGSGYKDVYYRKHLKDKPYQALIYRASRKDHINLGTFKTAKEAAVAVAEARLSGIESLQSPDKSRLERGSGGELTPTPLCLSAIRCNICTAEPHACTGKRKIESELPPVRAAAFNPSSLPMPRVVAVRPLSVVEREQVFAGAFARALAKPHGCADPANRLVFGTLPNGARLVAGGLCPRRADAMSAPAATPF